MAQKRIVTLVDDTDGSEAAETVRFMLDRTDYEIDLSELNARALRSALTEFRDHARLIPAVTTPKRIRTRTRKPSARTLAIKEWAKANGYDVKERGRIPADIVAKYELAAQAEAPSERANLRLGTGAAEPARAAGSPAPGPTATEPAEQHAEPQSGTSGRMAPPAGASPQSPPESPANHGATDGTALIRKWARQRGYKVGTTGRIPANIIADYEAFHNRKR